MSVRHIHRVPYCCFETLLGAASQKRSDRPIDAEGLSLVVREIRDKKSRNCSNCDTSMKLSVNVALNI